jgi:hypothetical protein
MLKNFLADLRKFSAISYENDIIYKKPKNVFIFFCKKVSYEMTEKKNISFFPIKLKNIKILSETFSTNFLRPLFFLSFHEFKFTSQSDSINLNSQNDKKITDEPNW